MTPTLFSTCKKSQTFRLTLQISFHMDFRQFPEPSGGYLPHLGTTYAHSAAPALHNGTNNADCSPFHSGEQIGGKAKEPLHTHTSGSKQSQALQPVNYPKDSYVTVGGHKLSEPGPASSRFVTSSLSLILSVQFQNDRQENDIISIDKKLSACLVQT